MRFLLPPPETPHHSLFTRCMFQLHGVTGVQQMWPCLCTWCSLGLERWLDTFPSAGLTGASFHWQPGLITSKLSLPPSSYPPPGPLLQPPGLSRACSYHTEYSCVCCSFDPNLTTEGSHLSLRLHTGYQEERGGCSFYLCGVHLCMQIHVCAHACAGPKATVDVFLSH